MPDSHKLNDSLCKAHPLQIPVSTGITNTEINKGSPFNHFGDGNSKTLSLPDIRDKLIAFYQMVNIIYSIWFCSYQLAFYCLNSIHYIHVKDLKTRPF